MHEWALAEGVISTALQVAEREGLNEITAIKIKMGELQQIDLEIFELALREISQSQLMVANARTELEREAAVLKCRVCGREWAFGDALLAEEERESIHFLPEIAHTYITCPECKSPDFQFVKGRGVWIDSIVGS
ncbi:MAG: hydrogenase nickel incorporation protein HypA [Dehalococcoidia bacterium]|nr:hydrogenase nickel incorporation protein HypA [Chloroflexota bacterium]